MMNTQFWKNRLGIIAGIGLVFLMVWGPHQWRLHQKSQALNLAQAREKELAGIIIDQQKQNELEKKEIERIRIQAEKTKSDIAFAKKEIARVNPDSLWAAPPEQWPDWNASSPYVWLRKETLPRLNIRSFANNGQLADGLAEILAIPPEKLAALNEKLAGVTDEAKKLKISKVERIEADDNGKTYDETKKVVIRVDALGDGGKRLLEEYKNTLITELGEERTDLLIKSDGNWLEKTFGFEGNIMSVEVTKDGMLEVKLAALSGAPSSVSCMPIPENSTMEEMLRYQFSPEYFSYFNSIKLH